MIELSVGVFVGLIVLSVIGALFLVAVVVGFLIGQAVARGKRDEERARLDQLHRETGLK